MHLPGNIRYVVDYVVFWPDGDISWIDVKGVDTPVSKLKRKQVEAIYPIDIEVVSKVKHPKLDHGPGNITRATAEAG